MWSHVANLLTIVSIVGLSVLGVVGEAIAFNVLICSAIIIGVIGVVGRWLDAMIDKEEEYCE